MTRVCSAVCICGAVLLGGARPRFEGIDVTDRPFAPVANQGKCPCQESGRDLSRDQRVGRRRASRTITYFPVRLVVVQVSAAIFQPLAVFTSTQNQSPLSWSLLFPREIHKCAGRTKDTRSPLLALWKNRGAPTETCSCPGFMKPSIAAVQ